MTTRKWFSTASGRSIKDEEIAGILGVTRKTVIARFKGQAPANDIITIARALELNPVEALVNFEVLTQDEVYDYVESDGKLLSTAETPDLIRELARNELTKAQLEALADQR